MRFGGEECLFELRRQRACRRRARCHALLRFEAAHSLAHAVEEHFGERGQFERSARPAFRFLCRLFWPLPCSFLPCAFYLWWQERVADGAESFALPSQDAKL